MSAKTVNLEDPFATTLADLLDALGIDTALADKLTEVFRGVHTARGAADADFDVFVAVRDASPLAIRKASGNAIALDAAANLKKAAADERPASAAPTAPSPVAPIMPTELILKHEKEPTAPDKMTLVEAVEARAKGDTRPAVLDRIGSAAAELTRQGKLPARFIVLVDDQLDATVIENLVAYHAPGGKPEYEKWQNSKGARVRPITFQAYAKQEFPASPFGERLMNGADTHDRAWEGQSVQGQLGIRFALLAKLPGHYTDADDAFDALVEMGADLKGRIKRFYDRFVEARDSKDDELHSVAEQTDLVFRPEPEQARPAKIDTSDLLMKLAAVIDPAADVIAWAKSGADRIAAIQVRSYDTGLEDYEAVVDQIGRTISAGDVVKMKRQAENILAELATVVEGLRKRMPAKPAADPHEWDDRPTDAANVLINANLRRLRVLMKQQAHYGAGTDGAIVNEIADIQAIVRTLRAEVEASLPQNKPHPWQLEHTYVPYSGAIEMRPLRLYLQTWSKSDVADLIALLRDHGATDLWFDDVASLNPNRRAEYIADYMSKRGRLAQLAVALGMRPELAQYDVGSIGQLMSEHFTVGEIENVAERLGLKPFSAARNSTFAYAVDVIKYANQYQQGWRIIDALQKLEPAFAS